VIKRTKKRKKTAERLSVEEAVDRFKIMADKNLERQLKKTKAPGYDPEAIKKKWADWKAKNLPALEAQLRATRSEPVKQS